VKCFFGCEEIRNCKVKVKLIQNDPKTKELEVKKIEKQMRVKQLDKNDMSSKRRTRKKGRDNKIEN